MRKKVIVVLLIAILAIASILSLAGCTSKVEEQAAWEAYEKAMANSAEHLQNNGSYFIKYRYNGQNSKGEKAVVTQKLNVVYGNSNIKDWNDFVVVDKGVEKAARYTTDYLNTYFGYSLKSGVKAKNAKREDYALGYFNMKGEFSNSENVARHLGRLKELINGKRKSGYAYGRGEKYTVELGGDINRALGSEFAMLATPETLPLFLQIGRASCRERV